MWEHLRFYLLVLCFPDDSQVHTAVRGNVPILLWKYDPKKGINLLDLLPHSLGLRAVYPNCLLR